MSDFLRMRSENMLYSSFNNSKIAKILYELWEIMVAELELQTQAEKRRSVRTVGLGGGTSK